jgi:hypothetical protein
MKVFGKTLGLLLVGLALTSCGGGGGNGGSYSPPQSGSITLSATTTNLPVNVWGYVPTQYGNPTQAEVTITWRNADGTLVTGKDIAVSIAPTNVAALSCLVDGDACEDGNALFGSIPIKGINGQATIFVNATDTAGTANFTVSGVDPTTSRTVSASLQFHVTSGVGPLPATVTLAPTPSAVYLPSSGGSSNSSISATVKDGAGQLVPDPVSGNNGFDNIQFDLVGETGDAILSSNSVSGPSSGRSVTSHTVHGVATASFQAGNATPQGPVQVRATVDRADNNVTNGVQDPVTFTTSVVVSDGKLYSLELTSPVFAPNLPGITINSVSGNVSADDESQIPPDPDATLTLTITALAKDRQGNPPIPGTAIRFGLVDEPVGAPGTADDNRFLLSGLDGNPKEGGNLFTAPTGQFSTAGVNGANSGDALLVFGRAVEGNADLESAVTVTSVNGATSLNVTPTFNYNYRNDAPIDTGSVLPYLIGRAMHGNITTSATTDERGIVHAKLNYTVNTVGNVMAIWAQGDGIDRVNDGPRRVTAAGTLVYPGVAPATISASPDPILGDTTDQVTVCVADALGIPLRGLQVSFQFDLAAGTGSVDGQSGSGAFTNLTDLNGCSTGTVVTSGVPATPADGPNSKLNLAAAGQTTSVGIVVDVATLQVAPNSVSVPTAGRTTVITVTARTADGIAVPGAVITGTCSASGGDGAAIALSPGSATTGGAGTAAFTAAATKFVKPGDPPVTGTGQCVFSAEGTNNATVQFNGVSTCEDVSPPDPACGT